MNGKFNNFQKNDYKGQWHQVVCFSSNTTFIEEKKHNFTINPSFTACFHHFRHFHEFKNYHFHDFQEFQNSRGPGTLPRLTPEEEDSLILHSSRGDASKSYTRRRGLLNPAYFQGGCFQDLHQKKRIAEPCILPEGMLPEITSRNSRNSKSYKRGRVLLKTSFSYCHIVVRCTSYGGGSIPVLAVKPKIIEFLMPF